MAGTLFSLGLSQRVDSNGKPAVGNLLYTYSANSSTPTNTYLDFALTIQNPWPLAADANGMLPPFWVADGAYRARATSSDGSVTYFDVASVTAVGPSAGSAPSGGVDATAIFATGDVLWVDFQGTRSGWVRDNGRTLGSASSGASERANADCQALFEYLWNNFADSICPVAGGRGGSALSDFSANKQITLPDKRGYVPGGLDDMGNSAAGRWASVPVVSGNVTTAGSVLGEATHALSIAELAVHTHTATVTDPNHTHLADISSAAGVSTTHAAPGQNANTETQTMSTVATGVTVANANTGSGTAHNTVQKTVLGTFFRKL